MRDIKKSFATRNHVPGAAPGPGIFLSCWDVEEAMRTEIGILGTEYLRDFIETAMKRLNLGVKHTLYTYGSFHDLPEVYRQIPDRITGIITSGSFPSSIILKSFPAESRIIRPFNNDNAGIYKLFLKLVKRDRSLDLSRVFADILETSGLDLEEFLYGEADLAYADALDSHIASLPLEELVGTEERLLEKHLDLWRERRIDLSVTRFSYIATHLEQAGLNVQFAYPGINYLRKVCLETLQAMRISDLFGKMMAVIMVTTKSDGREDAPEMAGLLQSLKRFNTVNRLDYLIRPAQFGFEVLTSRQVVVQITDGFRNCRLQEFLVNRHGAPIHVGYGIGEDMYQARINAADANREAARLPYTSSCLINERDELIGPLRSPAPLVVSREVSEAVKADSLKSGLSYLTIQKIRAACAGHGEPLTSRELAHKLSITTRSANRFLSSLAEAGLAEVVEVRRGTTKGRPERVYALKFDR